jgi:hypothetical protein
MTKRFARRRPAFALPLTVALLSAVAGCTATPQGPGSPAPRASSSPIPAPSDPSLGGRPGDPAAAARAGVTVRHFALTDGTRVTSATFTGSATFVLHCGSLDPGPACRGKVRAGPAVGRSERGALIAAFNGGFKLSANAGGYEQEGAILRPLRRGLASLVIYKSGQASIGVWGHGLPRPGQPVYSVRQNLRLLVSRGRPTPASAVNWGYWGGTVTGTQATSRSALGQNARGQLVYVASMLATPHDMAQALVHAGAVIGMELDINPGWVQLDFATRPGGRLVEGIPGQWQPADTYLKGWTRDYITVLAGGQTMTAPGVRLSA